jgi:hypothetical protein
MLIRHRMSYTRPTYVLAKANPEAQEKYKADIEALKKNDV